MIELSAYGNVCLQDERRAVLLLITTRSATLGAACMLDHWMGERYRAGRSHVFVRLPDVRPLDLSSLTGSDVPYAVLRS